MRATVRVTTGFCWVGPGSSMRMLTLSGLPPGGLLDAGPGPEARPHALSPTSRPASSRPGRRERPLFLGMVASLWNLAPARDTCPQTGFHYISAYHIKGVRTRCSSSKDVWEGVLVPWKANFSRLQDFVRISAKHVSML